MRRWLRRVNEPENRREAHAQVAMSLTSRHLTSQTMILGLLLMVQYHWTFRWRARTVARWIRTHLWQDLWGKFDSCTDVY